MPRGVALRPDAAGCAAVRGLWEDLARASVPSVAQHRKSANEPHLSLTVAGHLDADEVRERLAGTSLTPSHPVVCEGLGVFPRGVLHVVAIPDERLLAVQRLVHEACVSAPSTRSLRSVYAPGSWTPHLTLGYGATPAQVGMAAEGGSRAAIPAAGPDRLDSVARGRRHE